MAVNERLKKQNVVEVAEEFFTLAKGRNVETSVQPLQTQFQGYQAGRFHLVVVGEIKKGKSSFINALLGEPELLPVDVPVTTSTVYKLMYGDVEKYQVFFNPPAGGGTAKEPIYIARAELTDYGTEDGNPGNEKEVDHIAIELPNPLLRSGVIITDTPGIGGLFAEHGDITLKNAPTADAVCFVVDSIESVVSQEEMEHLKKFLELPTKVQGIPPSLFFVQTKIDAASSEEQWQQYRERNLDIISEHLAVQKETLSYFPVSAELKHVADQESDSALQQDSGFPQLLNFFNTTLFREKDERLARTLLMPISDVTEKTLIPSLDQEKNVFEMESKEKLDQLHQESSEAKKRFVDWVQNEMPQSLRAFDNSAADLRRETSHRLQNELDFTPTAPIIKSIMDDLREQNLTANQLEAKFGEIQGTCADTCQKIYADIFEEYQEKMRGLMAQTADKLESSLKRSFTSGLPGITPILSQQLDSHISRFGLLRELVYAPLVVFMGVGMITAILTGGAATAAGGATAFAGGALLFPPFGPVLAAGIAVCIYCAWRDAKKRGQIATRAQIQGALSNAVRDTQRQAIQVFEKRTTQLEREFQDLVTDIRDEIQAEQARTEAAINDSRRQTSAARAQKTLEIQAKIDQGKGLIRRIQMMLDSDA